MTCMYRLVAGRTATVGAVHAASASGLEARLVQKAALELEKGAAKLIAD